MAKQALAFSDDAPDGTQSQKVKKEPLTSTKVNYLDSHSTIEAVVASVSPAKDSSSFFDGAAVIRVIGFNTQ